MPKKAQNVQSKLQVSTDKLRGMQAAIDEAVEKRRLLTSETARIDVEIKGLLSKVDVLNEKRSEVEREKKYVEDLLTAHIANKEREAEVARNMLPIAPPAYTNTCYARKAPPLVSTRFPVFDTGDAFAYASDPMHKMHSR